MEVEFSDVSERLITKLSDKLSLDVLEMTINGNKIIGFVSIDGYKLFLTETNHLLIVMNLNMMCDDINKFNKEYISKGKYFDMKSINIFGKYPLLDELSLKLKVYVNNETHFIKKTNQLKIFLDDGILTSSSISEFAYFGESHIFTKTITGSWYLVKKPSKIL